MPKRSGSPGLRITRALRRQALARSSGTHSTPEVCRKRREASGTRDTLALVCPGRTLPTPPGPGRTPVRRVSAPALPQTRSASTRNAAGAGIRGAALPWAKQGPSDRPPRYGPLSSRAPAEAGACSGRKALPGEESAVPPPATRPNQGRPRRRKVARLATVGPPATTRRSAGIDRLSRTAPLLSRGVAPRRPGSRTRTLGARGLAWEGARLFPGRNSSAPAREWRNISAVRNREFK